MKTILYGHAWLSGALTACAFFGFLRAFGDPRQAWVWVALVTLGLLWTVLGFSWAATRDLAGDGGGGQEGPAPSPGPGRPAEEAAAPARVRGTPLRNVAPLLMLLVFLTVAVLLAGAAGGWWTPTSRPPARFDHPTTRLPRPFVNPTVPGRP